MQYAPPQPQGFRHLENSIAVNTSQHIGHFTGSNHEYTLSEHTAVAHIANWLHQDNYSPMKYAPPLLQGS